MVRKYRRFAALVRKYRRFAALVRKYRRFAALVSSIAASRLWYLVSALRASGSKYQVSDTSIPDTRGAQSAPIPARRRAPLVRMPCVCERDRSGTTRRGGARPRPCAKRTKGDGADSPTRARRRRAKRLAQT